jgi:hypothetical protein
MLRGVYLPPVEWIRVSAVIARRGASDFGIGCRCGTEFPILARFEDVLLWTDDADEVVSWIAERPESTDS